jgi:hypothetical protein
MMSPPIVSNDEKKIDRASGATINDRNATSVPQSRRPSSLSVLRDRNEFIWYRVATEMIITKSKWASSINSALKAASRRRMDGPS